MLDLLDIEGRAMFVRLEIAMELSRVIGEVPAPFLGVTAFCGVCKSIKHRNDDLHVLDAVPPNRIETLRHNLLEARMGYEHSRLARLITQ